MDFPSSLQDQQIEIKSKFSPHFGFLLLFAVSVSLNFYFLFFDGKNSVETAKAIPQEEVALEIEQTISQEKLPSIKLYPRLQKFSRYHFQYRMIKKLVIK